jgi:hypothetical protein
MITNVVEALKVGLVTKAGLVREGDDQLLLPIIVSDPALQMPAGLSTIYCTSTYDRRTGWTEQNKS